MKHILDIVDLSKLETNKEIHLTNNIIVKNIYGDIVFKQRKDKRSSLEDISIYIKKEDLMNEIKFSDYKVTKLTFAKFVSKTIKDLQTAWLFLGWQASKVTDKKDFVTLKILNTLLGGGMSSRMYKNLREQDGLAYQLGSAYTPKALGGFFMTYIGTNSESLDYSREKIKSEIERLKMEFVSDSELQDAKDRLKGSFIIALETNSEKASVVGLFETIGLGYDFLDEYVKMIDEVSASDIIRVANKYFNNIYVESNIK
jgi:predicted Zn-dependent peptidase